MYSGCTCIATSTRNHSPDTQTSHCDCYGLLLSLPLDINWCSTLSLHPDVAHRESNGKSLQRACLKIKVCSVPFPFFYFLEKVRRDTCSFPWARVAAKCSLSIQSIFSFFDIARSIHTFLNLTSSVNFHSKLNNLSMLFWCMQF